MGGNCTFKKIKREGRQSRKKMQRSIQIESYRDHKYNTDTKLGAFGKRELSLTLSAQATK